MTKQINKTETTKKYARSFYAISYMNLKYNKVLNTNEFFNFITIYCSCGSSYSSVCPSSLSKEEVTCSVCGCNDFESLTYNDHQTKSFLNHSEVYNNEKTVSLSLLFNSYLLTKERLIMNHNKIRITVNKETGIAYSIFNGKLRNFTYCNSKVMLHISKFLNDSSEFRVNALKFLKLILEERNIRYYGNKERLEELIRKGTFSDEDVPYEPLRVVANEKPKVNVQDLFTNIILISRFPALADIEGKIKFVDSPREKHIKKLFSNVKQSNNLNEVLNNLYNINTKKVRNFVSKYGISYKLVLLLNSIDDINYVNMFIDKYIDSTSYVDNRDLLSYSILNSDNYKTFLLCDSLNKGKIPSNILGNRVLSHENIVVGFYFLLSKTNNYSKLINLLLNYEDESCIQDIGRMLLQIRDEKLMKEADNLTFENTLQYLHDELVSIYLKQTKKEVFFNYSEEEVNYYSEEIGDISISLAASNIELSRIGRTMNICVGSYDKNAMNRDLYIIKAVRNNENIACIELSVREDSIVLVQLKGKRNSRVSLDLAEIFLEYFHSRNITTAYSKDMILSIEDSNRTKVFENNRKLLPEVSK